MGNNKSQVQRLGRDLANPIIKPYIAGQIGEPDQDNILNTKEQEESNDNNFFVQMMNQPTAVAESRFTQEEISKIRKEFDKLSKDQVIGKRKLLEYFRLMEINDTYLTNEIFFMIKNSSALNNPTDKGQAEGFRNADKSSQKAWWVRLEIVDYNKFINFVSIISKGQKQEKLQLLYSFFDKTPDGKISKEELKAHISGTILSLAGINFDDSGVESLKQSICRAQEAQIEAALDILVDEIFQKYTSNQEEMSFDEWSAWFLGLEGMKEVLELKPHKSQKNNSGAGRQSNTGGLVNAHKRDKGYLEKTSSLNSSKNVR